MPHNIYPSFRPDEAELLKGILSDAQHRIDALKGEFSDDSGRIVSMRGALMVAIDKARLADAQDEMLRADMEYRRRISEALELPYMTDEDVEALVG